MQLQYKPQLAHPPVGFLWELKIPSYQHMDGNGKRILYIGNSHLVILWESYGNSHGNPVGVPIWESCGNSHRNPVGMGMGIEIPFPRQP